MNRNGESFLPRQHPNESGQVLIFVAFLMVVLLAMVGFVIDAGDVYYSYHELQASSDAAALAGASALPNTTATAVATTYSSVAGGKNIHANLPNVTMVSGYPQAICLSSLTTLTTQPIPCLAPATANAIVVKQTASVPMFFATILGIKTMTITATATAAMRGAKVGSHNVVIVLDTTQSMNSTDSSSNCNDTRLNCALSGIQMMLGSLTPCGSSCCAVTQGNVANPVDQVSLMVFPGLASNQAQYDYDCANNTSPQISPYSYPTLPTYQIIPFSSDYRISNAATSLNSSSNLARAVGAAPSCTSGLSAVGGEGTYYAGVLYAAQAALAAQAVARPNAQNVLVLLSDGDANAKSSAMPGASTTALTYASTQNQCHQAITAAQSATAAGTVVYAVAYGATSSGCSTDSPSITPCQTMQQIASSSATFFSDYTATGGSSTCISSARPSTSLNQIFTDIAGDFGGARLVPNNLQ
jgi:hypothetical protein